MINIWPQRVTKKRLRRFNLFMDIKIVFITLITFSASSIISQELPNEFFHYKKSKILNDGGENWPSLSTFGPIRQSYNPNAINDSLNIHTRMGVIANQKAIAFYGYGHFSYKKNFYAYVYPRIVNDPSQFQRFSGIARDITRGGFSSGETDLSGIGFQNDWLIFQLGRGRQSWGSGENIQLALGEQSASYDYTLLGLDFGRIRARYFHGFLETVDRSINRYITARGVEWTNKKSIIIGLSETVIYSGNNRPIDIGYLNPISTHLEIELNDRLNALGTGSANAVWQLSIDWRPIDNVRISGNLLYDEFVLDKIQFEEGKENGKAYSAKVAFSPIKNDYHLFTLFMSTIFVGTPTFRHGSGYNNFVQRQKPLGWIYGSDGEEFSVGAHYFNRKNMIGTFTGGKRSLGDERITLRPYDQYEDYLAGPFPSGEIEEISFFTSEFQWWWKKNLSIIMHIQWESSNIHDKNTSLTMGLDMFFPKDFKL